MSKWGTFGHLIEGIAAVTVPGAAQVIKAAHVIHDQHGQPRADAILDLIDGSLTAAGDLSGKAALSDPGLRALAKKYAEDGLALHAMIEAAKKKQAAPAAVSGSTGE